jgi:DNA-directed RNA polymerase subunit F
MILNKKSLTLAEVKQYRGDVEEKKAIDEYLTKFVGKMTVERAHKISEALNSLNNPKIKEDHIVKVIDFLPEDTEEVNRIFSDVSLTEEEANAVLGAIKG